MRLVEQIARNMASADGKAVFWQQYEVHARKVIEALKQCPSDIINKAVVYDMYEPDNVANFCYIIDAILNEKNS